MGWHYDNASFAITLMIQAPEAGGEFEYLEKLRNKEAGEQGYADTEAVIRAILNLKHWQWVMAHSFFSEAETHCIEWHPSPVTTHGFS